MTIKRILVAADFSECSRSALEFALGLAEQVGATIEVVHAWASPAYVSPSIAVTVAPDVPSSTLEVIAREEAGKSMDAFLASVPTTQKVTGRIEFGPEAEVIVAIAEQFDLLIVGTHGRSGLAHFVLGSVAERIVRRSKTPVLTVPTRNKN